MSLTLFRRRPKNYDNIISRGLIRPVEQWEQIFRDQTDGSPQEIAARIFGDIHCFSGERANKPRPQFYEDIEQLANALQAFANR